ncbi:MAG: hypothetical protein IKG56_05200 [Clostridia bacterium]|nr:hypothetical protein [Clostridia bacterium]
MDKYMSTLEDFFSADADIKNMLIQCAPTEMDEYDEESRIRYFDRIHHVIGSVKSKMSSFLQSPFFLEERFLDKEVEFQPDGTVKESIKESKAFEIFIRKIEDLERRVIELEASHASLRQVYSSCLSGMDEGLIKDVSTRIYGENSVEQLALGQLLARAKTINEMLHILHFHTENSNRILEALPILDQKEIAIQPGMTPNKSVLIGDSDNALARSIFEQLPLDTRYAYTVALQDRILMMVRDAGHALTLQIIENPDGSAQVSYFIPKVTDADAVLNLPSVQQNLDIENQYASGLFVASSDDTAHDICSFIQAVPGDRAFKSNIYANLVISGGNMEKAMSYIESGIISPRNLLMYLNMARIEQPELREKVNAMIGEEDRKKRTDMERGD